MSVALRRKLRQVHRILGLLVGIQVLFWVGGGLFMSAFPIETVRGEHLTRPAVQTPLPADPQLVTPAQILAANPAVTELRLRNWLGRPVYTASSRGQDWLIDARSGRLLSPIGAAEAQALAEADYAGDAPVASITLMESPRLEVRGRKLPLWRIEFADALHTTVYVAPDNGQIVARRNTIWRAFDIVWMLHIMDYRERDNFNHPLLIGFAATTLAFVFSGLCMLWIAFRRGSSRA